MARKGSDQKNAKGDSTSARSVKALHEVRGLVMKGQKARFLQRAAGALADGATLTPDEIKVTALARPIGGGSAAPPTLGIVVMDTGNDRDQIIETDLDDMKDKMEYGDKDFIDKRKEVDKDGKNWPF